MGLFGNGNKIKQLQSQIARLQQQSNTSLFANASAVFPKWDINKVADRYCCTDDIYAIVSRIATTSALIPIYAYFEKNERAAKQLKQFNPNGKPWEQKLLMTKALEDLPETDPVYDLMENPSDLMSKYEFYEVLYSMLNLHGECIIWKERGEVRNTPRKLHILFPQFVVLKVSRSWPQTILGYDYIVDGFTVMQNIPVEDIIHIKYFNPNYSISGHELRGLSPLKVLGKRLARMDNALDISVSQMANGGVKTIVTIEDLTSNDDVKQVLDNHKDNFYRYSANMQNSGSVYWANGKIDATPLGLKLADMELAALEKTDFKKLCNAYRISDRLFNNDAKGSEVSDDNARKALYTDACLPNVFRVAAALQNGLKDDFTDKKRVIQADISEIPELQENMTQLAEWLNVCWWVTPNQKLELMKFEKNANPIFDQPVIPTGLQLLDDLTMVDNLPNPANDYISNEPK